MSEENSSMSNKNTQPKTGGLLSLSNHTSNGESGDSVLKNFENNTLKPEKTTSDNKVEPANVSGVQSNKYKNNQ